MGDLLAGASRKSILPDEAMIKAIAAEDPVLNGFDGCYEDIFTRVIVLSDGSRKMALISADLNRFPDQQGLCKRLAEEFGIDPLGCIIGSSRNHQAPCGNTVEENPPLCRRIAGPALTAYTGLVHDRTCAAVREALETMESAEIGAADSVSNINTNIDWDTPAGCLKGVNYTGISDKTLNVVKVRRTADKSTIGVFVAYPLHSTMFAQNMRTGAFTKIGGDTVGSVCRFVEKAGKDRFPVVYVSSDGGDQELMVYDEIVYCDVDENGEFRKVEEILPVEACRMLMKLFASQQGVDILRTLASISEYRDDFDFFAAEEYRELEAQMSVTESRFRAGEENAADTVVGPLKLRLRLAVLNGIAFAGYNAEITAAAGTELRSRMPFPHTALVSTCYGHIGTVPDGTRNDGKVVQHSFVKSPSEARERMLDAFDCMCGQYRNRNNNG